MNKQFLDRDRFWESREDERLNEREAAHLFRRAAFGANQTQCQAATGQPLGAVVDRLLADPLPEDPLEKNFQQMKAVAVTGNLSSQLPAWWLYRMIHSSQPALERLTLFWHGHFATSAAKVPAAALMLRQNETLRRNALGRFADMVLQMSRDPAMLLYLDSATNRRNRPNENYARELLELFCLGLGNYTEQDIKELARAFTGWELRGEVFQYNAFQHDPGPKHLLGQSGLESGEEAIQVIVRHPATARFIAIKWLRYYLSDEGELDPQWIEPLAATLRDSDFDLRAGLRRLLTSRLFYSECSLGKKIRSPVDLAVGLLRSLPGTANTLQLAERTRELGQALFFPPNVKGWDGGRQWINSASLIGRINLVTRLLDDANRLGSGSSSGWDAALEIESTSDAVDRAAALLLAVPLLPDQRQSMIAAVDRRKSNEPSRWLSAIKVLSTLAEFQLA